MLSAADVIACEDTRHVRRLLDRHGISGRVVSYHEHNERNRSRELLERVAAGELVALVSDAGTPLVSDPGFEIVRECLARDPPRGAPRGERDPARAAPLRSARRPAPFRGLPPPLPLGAPLPAGGDRETIVAFESPRRLAGTLATLAAEEPDRRVAVCRELTKLHEEVRRGSAAELEAHYRGNPPRGEIVLVCAPAQPGRPALGEAVKALSGLLDAGARPRPAATAIARLTGIPANELYRALTSGPTRG